MIPKILHYCWLSDEPIPAKLQNYIDGWKKVMPDYELKKWDKNKFDIHSVKWVEEAYSKEKWAFASDYIRAYALYTDGGFYLDSDVKVLNKFDEFLNSGFITSIEYDHAVKEEMQACLDSCFHRKEEVDFVTGLGIQAAIMGAEKGHPFMGEIKSFYETRNFINKDGTLNQTAAPLIYARFLENYGFVYSDEKQLLSKNVVILPSYVFAGYQTVRFSSKAVHMCAGSWVKQKKNNSIIDKLKKNLTIRQLCNLLGLGD